VRALTRFRGLLTYLIISIYAGAQVLAAPYADIVIDARTGQVLSESNADARLHPASLTKMMTLYIAFEAIKNGEISLDSMVTISARAAAEPPSKLGLQEGQKIKLRYLIRAAAIKSANDAATAIGEAIAGSEAAFARRMNRTAKALGMSRSQFKNANGLTEEGHYSTARDMTTLGRHLFYDHPEFYNLFSRRTADTGGRVVANTNSRFLDQYPGADGIKTGYTVAAGFNLTASAERDGVRIIATVFGGLSTAQRTEKMKDLMDIGFDKAPKNARTKKPTEPVYADVEDSNLVADAGELGDDAVAEIIAANVAESVNAQGVAAGKTIRVMTSPATSPMPRARPAKVDPNAAMMALAEIPTRIATEAETAALAAEKELQAQIETALHEASLSDLTADDANVPTNVELAAFHPVARPARAEPAPAVLPETMVAALEVTPAEKPLARPETEVAAAAPVSDAVVEVAAADPVAEAVKEPVIDPQAVVDVAAVTDVQPAPAAPVIEAEVFEVAAAEPVVVSRLSTSGGRHWAINVGTYNSSYEAEKTLLRTALQEIGTLDEALRKVVKTKKGFDANFVGLTEDTANLACQRLAARSVPCLTIGPTS
jgi:D-alanyl-D-alanine carboxypeptidase